MPYRLWHVIVKFVGPPLLPLTFGAAYLFHRHDTEATAWLFVVSLATLVALGVTGAVMGLMVTFGRLRMRCPFCGLSGEAGGNKRDGLYMHCEQCGYVHTAGVGGWKIVREGREAAEAPVGNS